MGLREYRAKQRDYCARKKGSNFRGNPIPALGGANSEQIVTLSCVVWQNVCRFQKFSEIQLERSLLL